MSDEAGTLINEAANLQQDDAAGQAPAGEPPAGKAPGQDGADDAASGKAPKSEKATAPEKYEFKHPQEGQQYDAKVTEAFSAVAKELNLSQEAAQSVMDKMSPVIAARQQEALSAARQEWREASQADKEFGGEMLAENLGFAKKAIDAYATPELKNLLEESGLGNNPEVVRLFYRVGKSMGEDGFVAGRGAAVQAKDARSLYGASKMNP